MKRLLFILIFALLSACAPTATPEYPDMPVDSNTPPNGLPPTYAPRPGDDQMMRDGVYLDSTDMLVMESYPPQFALMLKGNLPTPCHELRVVYHEPDSENKINLEVYSVAQPDAVCVMVLQPFEQNINLGSFPSGHYTVWVNEEQVAEFDA
ncbi:MAG: hypothetical protein AB1554_10995 [Chloroflexota bacterium]